MFAVKPEWLTDTAKNLARHMCETKNYDSLPVLADALQDADCDNTYLLQALRDPTPRNWLAHLVADEMHSAPLPENLVDQGELFVYLRNTKQCKTDFEIVARFLKDMTGSFQYTKFLRTLWQHPFTPKDRETLRKKNPDLETIIKKISKKLKNH